MASQLRRSGRQGFTLVEMLIVVVVIAIVTAYAYPRAGAMLDHTAVRGARTAIANKFTAARNAARSSNQVAVFRLLNNKIWIELNAFPPLTSKTVVGGYVALDSNYRVSVTGPDSINIDSRGMITSNQTTDQIYVVLRRGWRDSVIINGYGRITR